MIAWLVQQQDVGLAEGDLGTGHSALLPSRQGVHGLQRQVTAYAKGPQMLPAKAQQCTWVAAPDRLLCQRPQCSIVGLKRKTVTYNNFQLAKAASVILFTRDSVYEL